MAKRVSALSQVLKETAPKQEPPKGTTQESDNSIIPQSDTVILPQNDNSIISQNDNTVKSQRRSTKTQERDKITYYLEPGQFDKLEEIRLAYKKATGTRLNEQELMRLIVDRISLNFLL